jgi:hypothetical protein
MMDPPDEVASDGESVEMGIDADNNEKSTKKVGWSVAEKNNDVEAGEDNVDEQEKAPGGITYCDHYSLQYPSSTVRFRTSKGKRVLYLYGNTVAFLHVVTYLSHIIITTIQHRIAFMRETGRSLCWRKRLIR